MKYLFVLLLMTSISLNTKADEPEVTRADYIRSNYSKYEYKISMRDGVKLFTAAYIPNDRSETYPILLFRTPYTIAPYGADQYKSTLGPDEEFEKEGYIFVFQDVRGRLMSEGDFMDMRPHNPAKKSNKDIDESTDTYDTIEWLINNIENHNGKVGQWGISYPGFYCSAGMIDTHPALKAVSPQAPIADWFWDDWHHHGALFLTAGFDFLYRFGENSDDLTTERPERFEYKTPDAYQFFLDMGPLKNANEKYYEKKIDFWNKLTEHPNYDAFWQARNILPHLKNINAAVMVVGGWYDAEDLYGTFNTYQTIERNNPGIFNIFVVGPWAHGGWGSGDGKTLADSYFGFNTAEFYRDKVLLKFFNHFLKEDDSDTDFPEAIVFETGANRWRSFDTWPPDNLDKRNLYFHSGNKMSFDQPKEKKDARDSYISDPSKPIPHTTSISNFYPRNYMAEDQRYAARRPDVLVYETDVLEEDITFAGPLSANLWVSTTGTASDWIVKIVDVNPNHIPDNQKSADFPDREAYQLLVRSEVFRGRFRESYEHPKPFVSNQVTEVSFELQDVLHTFKRGHRIMIQIQSTWFPLVDRNPQKYVPNIFMADENDFITVTNSVYRSENYPSHIEVGILNFQ
ncbi:CocE/NonD family hydrolase [Candidatus Latescibacterota bacterium]